MTKKLQLILFVILTAIFSCEPDGDDSAPGPLPTPVIKPDLEAKSATTYGDGGVTLEGLVNKVDPEVTNYGFVLSSDSLFTQPDIYFMGSKPSVGSFKKDIFGKLENGKKYYYTVFVQKTQQITPYNKLSFVSTGSKKIKITGISTTKGHLEDTLSILGKYFSVENINIKFGKHFSTAISKNDSVLTCIVPSNLDEVNPIITLNYKSKSDTASKSFTLYKPEISAFTPTGTFRDTVTLTGNHFDKNINRLEIKFGNVKARIVSANRKQLKVTLPDELESVTTTISVKAQLQTTVGNSNFVLKKPVFTDIPPKGYTRDLVMVRGKYFHPLVNRNKITFENNEAELNSGNTEQLQAKVPNGPFPRRKAKVKLKLLEYEIEYPADFIIEDEWVMVSNKLPFNDYQPIGAFTINNVSFVLANNTGAPGETFYLWKFNSSNNSWEKLDIPSDIKKSTGIIATNGQKAYVYTASENNSFWEYDPAINRWTNKAPFPGDRRDEPVMFTIGSKVYMGLGAAFGMWQAKPYFDFYEYNPITNNWGKIADYPHIPSDTRTEAASFVINDKAYVGCGAWNTGMTSFYQYNNQTNTWSSIANFPDARNYTTSFSLDQMGYVFGGSRVGGSGTTDCFQYNPLNNQWRNLNPVIPSAIGGVERGFSFVNNGKVYVSTGNSSNSRRELYEVKGEHLK